MPYRIALVGLLVIGALYLVVLRPKDPGPAAPPAPAATAPGVKGLTNTVGKARSASTAQTQSDAATQAAAGAASGTTEAATPTTAAPTSTAVKPPTTSAADPARAAATKDPSTRVLAELAQGHTAVMLFAGSHAADDRAVRRAVSAVRRRGGKVDVHVVPIRRVGSYEAITRGVTVTQSPTIVVISAKRTARTIVGFTRTAEINQLVADLRRG